MRASDLLHSPPAGGPQRLCAISVCALLALAVFAEIVVPHSRAVPIQIASSTGTFSFGAAGDYGFSPDAQAVMAAMGGAGLDFVVPLGDLSYGDTTEAQWCNAFQGQVGQGRVVLIAGNHDEGGSDGDINLFRQSCPFGIAATVTGDYAKEYYFDFPGSAPLARFILTGCGLSLDGASWDCVPGDPHYTFVSDAIDGAHAAGIPWVIVGMHKNCISNGMKSCAIGEAVQDLLLGKKVDLVLQGHDHNYQRSRRLICAQDDVFHPECVAPPGAWGQIITIVGTGGKSHDNVGGTPDEPYFETWNADTYGFLKVDVSATKLDARFVPVNGTYVDAFNISRGPPPSPSNFTLSANPTNLTLAPGQSGFVLVQPEAPSTFARAVNVSVSAPPEITGSCSPSTVTTQETSTCTLSGQTPGSYNVTVIGTSGSVVRSQNVSVSITEPPQGPDSTPPLITIESPAAATVLHTATVTVAGKASDDRGVQRVELSADGVSWTPATGTDSWSGTLTLPAGEQVIRARAADAAGNIGTAVVWVFVDLTTSRPSGPSGSPNLTMSDLIVYASLAVAAAIVAEGIVRLMRRRGRNKPPK